MAVSDETPDPRAFKDWEDAFQYPIPVIRKLEQQLRNNADENREKLRSLVGTSYRSLLDTAETIIDMELRINEVESRLSRVGQSCNSRRLERITHNTAQMDLYTKSRDAEGYMLASQLSVLRNAPLVMTRLMRAEGSHLLIAKVLVISRLVHKALGRLASTSPMVDSLGEQLLSVRRKLLRRIDKRLSSTVGETANLVESMCAYALATSSTPSDVLNHFHKIRLERMNSELKQGSEKLAKHGVSALKLCIQTCVDTQTLFPRRLAEALAKLKAHPLLQDPEVRGLYELNLDVYDRWLGDEARNYTPYPRHDELQRPDAEKILHRWSKSAIASFLKGIREAIEAEERLQEVSSLRSDLIETWILSGSRMAGIKSTDVLDDLRNAMNEKLERVVRSRSQGLQKVVTRLTSQLDILPSPSASDVSLWHTTSKAADLGDGAKVFKSTILNTYRGRDESVSSVTAAFDKWVESVLEVKGIVKSMKEARWDDTFADDVDDDSDEDLAESKQALLSDDDPRLLENATQEAMREALQNLGQSFSKIMPASTTNDASSIRKATFLLRVIRDINDRVPRLRLQDRSAPLVSPFTSSAVQPLYLALAEHVIQPSIQAYEKALLASTQTNKTNSHILWEGHPPLPSQPSPSAFRFLRTLHASMAGLGTDLWAPGCVSVLKERVSARLETLLAQQLQALGSSLQPGNSDGLSAHARDLADDHVQSVHDRQGVSSSSSPLPSPSSPCPSPPPSQTPRDLELKQLAFDALYLLRFTTPGTTTTTTGPDDLAAALRVVVELDDGAWDRLTKSVAEYAKKTFLLFGLLA